MPSHYQYAEAILDTYRKEVAKSETSRWSRRGLATDGGRILAFAQAHATLAVADALGAAEATEADEQA